MSEHSICIKEFCKFQEGYVNPSQTVPDYFDGDVKWLRANDLNNGRVYDTSRKLSLKGFNSAKKSAILFKPKSIAISKSGTIGKLGVLEDYMCGNRAIINIEVDPNIASNMYVFYSLLNAQKEIEEMAVGSVQKNLYTSILGEVQIPKKALQEQQSIAEVLSSLDDKMDLLHRNNKTLEEMAETLFRQWFVDLEFSSTINDVADVLNGYAFKSTEFTSEGVNHVIKIKNIGSSSVNISDCDRISDNTASKTHNKFKILSGDILIAMTGAEIGKMGIVGNTNNNLWLNQRVGSIRDIHDGSRYLAYLALKSELGQDYILNTASGSAQPNISGADIMKCPFPKIPKDQIIEKSQILKKLFDKVIHNLGQISHLNITRDILLPKLMSGQVVFS